MGQPTEGAILVAAIKVCNGKHLPLTICGPAIHVNTLISINFFWIYLCQLCMNDIRDEYIRLEEKPFSSEHKWMAVKCGWKRQQNAKVEMSNS